MVDRSRASIEQTLDLLELLARSQTTLGINAIAVSLGLSERKAKDLISVLKERGYVRQGPEGYTLGKQAIAISTAYADAQLAQLCRLAQPFVTRLRQITGETVHLSVLNGTEVSFLLMAESAHQLRLVSSVGDKVPAHLSAVGKAILSTFSDKAVRALYGERPLATRTLNSIKSVDELVADLARTRLNGCAFDDQESHLGAQCVGVYIRNKAGEVVAGLSVSAPVVRMKRDLFEREIRATAEEIGQLL